MGEDRLLKVVSSEAMEMRSRVRWAQDSECSLEIFGWGGVNVDALSGLAMEEVRCVLGRCKGSVEEGVTGAPQVGND